MGSVAPLADRVHITPGERCTTIDAGAEAPASFARVRDILDGALVGWAKDQERDPHTEVHGEAFGWSTYQRLMSGAVHIGDQEFRFIDPAMVGNGRARETWLVRYLSEDGDMFVRMPSGGPYLCKSEIDEIVRWIDAGCPEGAAAGAAAPAVPGKQSRAPDFGRAREFAQRFASPANGAALQLQAPRS